jgi:hypothetical protein
MLLLLLLLLFEANNAAHRQWCCGVMLLNMHHWLDVELQTLADWAFAAVMQAVVSGSTASD